MLKSPEGQYQRQRDIALRTVAAARKLWGRLGVEFSQDWERISPALQAVFEASVASTVVTALPYTAAVLAEQGVNAPRAGVLVPSRFVASAPSGAPLQVVLEEPIIHTRTLVGRGVPVPNALESGGKLLTGIVFTLLADYRRGVYGADMLSRRRVAGYVRMLRPPSCGRCAILAGKFFRWNQGFQRHPNCDCQHVPVGSESAARGLVADPYEYFHSLSREEQDRLFGAGQIGRSNARAIRDGADIYRVENVRMRGLSTANGRGRSRRYSTMTVDDIYRVAGTRTNAIRLLEQQGYIRGPQELRRAPEIYSAPISRPVVAGSNRARVLEARRTGVRDPLDTATMTVQERRLYDAWYRVNYAETRGGLARSTTGRLSSADVFSSDLPATRFDVLRLRAELDDEVARQFGSRPPESVVNLARILGLI